MKDGNAIKCDTCALVMIEDVTKLQGEFPGKAECGCRSENSFNDYGIFPLTIIMDRYGGSYSGGKWLATSMGATETDDAIGCGDVEENEFWGNWNSDSQDYDHPHPNAKWYGRGETPQAAVADLKKRLDKLREQSLRELAEERAKRRMDYCTGRVTLEEAIQLELKK